MMKILILCFFLCSFFLPPFYSARDDDTYKSLAAVDDIFDNPYVEIDDSLEDDHVDYGLDEAHHSEGDTYQGDSVEESDDMAVDYSPSKKSFKELPPLRKDTICSESDTSNECLCYRSCAPYYPLSVSPCQCSSSSNTQAKPAGTQPSAPSYSSLIPTSGSVNSIDCTSYEHYSSPSCSCQRACIPGFPVNYNPCTCMEYSDNSYPASSYSYPSYPQYPTYLSMNSYPSLQDSLFGDSYQYAQTVPHLDQNSCARACLPYEVQQRSPCTCNYNAKADNTYLPYGAPVSSNAYDPSYNQWSQYKGQDASKSQLGVAKGLPGGSLNSHIPKRPRVETSTGSYLGCYRDKKKPGRDLKMNIPVPKLTPDACVNKCREKKKRFAAVQNGYLCFCGSRFGRYNRTKDEECGVPCTGDPNKYCGGHWLNSVYSTDGQLYSPKQFSFKTKDPLDELEYEKASKLPKAKISNKPKTSKQGAKDKKTTTKAHSAKKHKLNNKVNKKEKMKVETRGIVSTSKKEKTPEKKHTLKGKSLESASTASDMAALLIRENTKRTSMKKQVQKAKPAIKHGNTKNAPKSLQPKIISHQSNSNK